MSNKEQKTEKSGSFKNVYLLIGTDNQIEYVHESSLQHDESSMLLAVKYKGDTYNYMGCHERDQTKSYMYCIEGFSAERMGEVLKSVGLNAS